MMENCFADKSDLTWHDGMSCLNEGRFNAAASRLYYAVFQAIYGFAIQRDLMAMDSSEPGRHRTAIRIAGGHGRHPREAREAVSMLYELRVKADYRPEDVDEPDLRDVLDKANRTRQYFARCL